MYTICEKNRGNTGGITNVPSYHIYIYLSPRSYLNIYMYLRTYFISHLIITWLLLHIYMLTHICRLAMLYIASLPSLLLRLNLITTKVLDYLELVGM